MTITLLAARHFSRRHFKAGTLCFDMKLRSSVRISVGKGASGLQASGPLESGTYITHWSRASCWFCIYYQARPSFAVCDPPLYESVVFSHSFPPLGGSLPQCVFDPYV
jgi:hypothetical protein